MHSCMGNVQSTTKLTWVKAATLFTDNDGICSVDPCRCATPQFGNQVLTFFGNNSGLYWTVFAQNRVIAVPVEGNGDIQTLICVSVVRPRWCHTLLNPVLWQSWMVAYPGYTLQMKMLFPGWPTMIRGTHTRRRKGMLQLLSFSVNSVFSRLESHPLSGNILVRKHFSLIHKHLVKCLSLMVNPAVASALLLMSSLCCC